MSEKIDQLGRRLDQRYSTILTDPSFERRLKAFDKNLRLMFDQHSKRWIILEWAIDHSGWNIIIKAEDSDGNAKPLGDWVFNQLYVYNHRYQDKIRNPAQFFKSLIYEETRQQEAIEKKNSDDFKGVVLDDINFWRKLSKERRYLPKLSMAQAKLKEIQNGNDASQI